MALSWAGNYKPRTPGGNTYFSPASESGPCADLDAYYAQKYPYAWLEGDWLPVSDASGSHYYMMTATGTWSEIIGNAALEVGSIELTGIGRYVSEGANSESSVVFEYTGDGRLYIDGEPYERRSGNAPAGAPPAAAVGSFFYYDSSIGAYSDRGYEFREDWTFRSLPDSPSAERGTFLFLGDNMLLYDEDGNLLHKFIQDRYTAELGGIYDTENNVDIFRLDD